MSTATQSKPSERFRSNTAAELTASEFLALFRKGDLSAAEYVRACADRIEELNPQYHAFEAWDRSNLEARAGKADALADKTAQAMPGVPLGIKDNINTYDFATGRGTDILKGYTPGNDARIVSDLRLAGGLVAGKTVTAEFGVHYPGATLYPFDTTRSPGTSSSGSAVAVATRMVPIALGTQTGGSIIRPASYCGILGFKPSFGTLARTGVLKTTDTLDTVGLMARSEADLRLALDSCRVQGHNYPLVERGIAATRRDANKPWRVGVVAGPKSNTAHPLLQEGFARVQKALAQAGAEVVEFKLSPTFWKAHDAHERIYSKALSYYLKEEYTWKPELFSGILRDMMEAGFAISAEQYHNDTQLQAELTQQLDHDLVQTGCDVVIDLATNDEAPVGLATRDTPDHNLIWTMCGIPVVSVPLLTGSTGLPVGISVMGRKYADYEILNFVRFLTEMMR